MIASHVAPLSILADNLEMEADTTIKGWVHTLTEQQFGNELEKVLSASHAIQSPEFLRGRDAQLTGIRQAWYASGRQIFIHGYRGVGKTSLAQTAAFQRQSVDNEPIILACTEKATFFSIIRDMMEAAFPSDPRVVAETIEAKGGASVGGLSAEMRSAMARGRVPEFSTMNEVIQVAKFLGDKHSEEPVVIVDEFDLLREPSDQASFAEFIKQVGDQRVPMRFIFCGIGESLDELFQAHQSAHRYFHTVKLDRLPWEPRFEIIDFAAQHLGIDVDDATRFRIAKISDGFPHYVHLLCEKLFWLVFAKGRDGKVTGDLFEEAMQLASDAMEPQLKVPYEKATRKYTNDYEEVLWAVADYHELQRPSHEIYQSYERIMKDLEKQPLTRSQFNSRMNRLKQPEYGSILVGTRAGWYEYSEKVVRGYARLRAEQRGVELDIEHPMQKPRHGGISKPLD